MATPITKTILELQLLSGGQSCTPVLVMLEEDYPGWNLETVIDIYEWCENLRTRGYPAAATQGIYRGLTLDQAKEFSKWGLTKSLTFYSTPALENLKTDLFTYLDNPSEALEDQIIQQANLLDINNRVEALFKAAAITITNDAINGESLQGLENALKRAGQEFSEISRNVTVGEILTKLEQIVGIRD